MWKYYLSLFRQVPGLLWASTNWYLRIGALIVFIISMFNRLLAELVQSAWRGISPSWFLLLVGVLTLFGLATANYLQVERLQHMTNDLTNRLLEVMNEPKPNVEFVCCGIEHREMGSVLAADAGDEAPRAYTSAWTPTEVLILPGSTRQFAVVKVRNNSKSSRKEANAFNCTVELEFLNSEGDVLQIVPGRWADTEQPVQLSRTQPLDWLNRVTIHVTDHPKTIDVAFKDPADDNAFIVTNPAIASKPDTWKLESMQLPPGKYLVRVTVKVEGQSPFPTKDYVLINSGTDGILQIGVVETNEGGRR